jgi:16S rRNA (guanine(527)-N(7))-methyltransferase GidB
VREDLYRELQAISGPVSRETLADLEAFQSEFLRWASRINLAAPSTLPRLWDRHILDSAQLMPLAPEASRWLDLGSGGGFPGAIIAILISRRSDSQVTLIESNRKKAAFLQTTLAALKAPTRILPRRIEDCYQDVPAPEIITARALAPLSRLFLLIEPWMRQGARALLHKGRDFQRELEESSDAWRFDLVEHRDKVGDGVILEIRDLHRA